jgi:hypothetical protein
MSHSAVTSGTGWTLARQMGSRVWDSARATRMPGPYVSITTSRPSRSAASSSRTLRSMSARLRAGGATVTSATPERAAAMSAA